MAVFLMINAVIMGEEPEIISFLGLDSQSITVYMLHDIWCGLYYIKLKVSLQLLLKTPATSTINTDWKSEVRELKLINGVGWGKEFVWRGCGGEVRELNLKK